MSGAQPEYRILTKPEGAEKFTEIAAIWKTAKADTFSVRLKIDGQEISGIMVKNQPKPPATAAKKAKAPQHKAA